MTDHPYYKGKPIGSVEALGRALGIAPRRLDWAARNAEKFYRPGPAKIKSDGTKREVYNPAKCLKQIQGRINKHILEQAYYPIYLQGGIRDRSSSRDYIRNATLHVGAKGIIREDIADFFPSITQGHVERIWKHFFHFPPTVAKILTALTTYRGCLPQGARTSTYLANLVLWDTEPEIVARFKQAGLCYSRYVDDVTISSRRRLSAEDKQLSVKLVRVECKQKGYRLKKKKHRIESADGPMHVHNLVVNRKVSLSGKEREKIRAAIHQLSIAHQTEGKTAEMLKEFNRTRGRVSNLARLHPRLGAKYKSELEKLAPITSDI